MMIPIPKAKYSFFLIFPFIRSHWADKYFFNPQTNIVFSQASFLNKTHLISFCKETYSLFYFDINPESTFINQYQHVSDKL